MKRIADTLTALVLVCSLLRVFMPGASAVGVEQYTLKAVYIEKFTRFVEWPEKSKIEDKTKPFVIGVVGDRSFEAVLKKLFADKTIRDKEVVIRRIIDLDKISDCQILLIPKVSNEELRNILLIVRKYPVLTISDTENFAENGVIINFFVSKKKLRFEINEKAVRESQLNISYRLMQVAKIVNPAVKEQK